MLVIKILGKQYDKNELQENSIIIRKWFAIRCIEKLTFTDKYYEIKEINKVEKQ